MDDLTTLKAQVQAMIEGGVPKDDIVAHIRQVAGTKVSLASPPPPQQFEGDLEDLDRQLAASQHEPAMTPEAMQGTLTGLGLASSVLIPGAIPGATTALKGAGLGALLGGVEGFIRTGDPKKALQDAAITGVTGLGLPLGQRLLTRTVGTLAQEAGRAFETGQRSARVSPIVSAATPGLSAMLSRPTSAAAIREAEAAALRNQLLHELRAR